MKEFLLKIEDIKKHFGGVYAINGVSLDITPGKIWGLVGPNGSGKSTLFNTVLGIHQPDEGNIYLNERRITSMGPHQIFDLGLVNTFQVPRLFQELTVLDNMLVAGRGHLGDNLSYSLFFRKRWQRKEVELSEKAMEILELLKLDHLVLSPAGELSGGQRKLLELGKGLMASPTILFLDEPAAGVNPNLGRSMFERIYDLCQKGLSFFIIEHRLELLFDFAHWVYVMDKGKIVLDGKPQEVTVDPSFFRVYLGDE